jgi:hypothetical protein
MDAILSFCSLQAKSRDDLGHCRQSEEQSFFDCIDRYEGLG